MAYITEEPEPLPGMTREEMTAALARGVQNGTFSVEEKNVPEPVVFTAQGPVPQSIWSQNAKNAIRLAELEHRVTKLEQIVELMEEVARLRRELKL